jgi:hypothetical protein
MAKRTPSGPVEKGSLPNTPDLLSDVVSMTASFKVDLGRAIRKMRNRTQTVRNFFVLGLTFEDAGGTAAETAQRISSVNNGDGTFTIYAEKYDDGTTAWIAATGTNKVRWSVWVVE